MNDSMAHPREGLTSLELPGWKTALGWGSAILICLLFVVSGLWKITDVHGAAVRMAQARVPESLSVAAALLFGIVETVGGVFILVPRFRRWGAIITGLLLLAFMAYVGVNYSALHGADCSCFPWLKRVVGPGFFVSDGVMLLLAVFAGVWAKRPEGVRNAALIVGAVVVFALVSFGANVVRQRGATAPAEILVSGQPYSIRQGKYFLFFFNPECGHCLEAAKGMARLGWGETKVVAVPVEQPQYSAAFLNETGLQAIITSDFPKLKEALGYTAYPYGVAVEDGRRKASMTTFDANEPAATLRRLGFVN